ncbi:MAG: LTA synthase family protein [Planctomycetota bacterium]
MRRLPERHNDQERLINGAGRRAPFDRWFAHPRVRPVALLVAVLIALFTVQRGLLVVLEQARLDPIAPAELVRLFAVGLRQDLRVLAWAALPLVPLVGLMPNAAFRRRWHRRAVIAYVAGVLVVAASVCIVDTLFFVINDSRINWQVPDYLFEREILAHLWRRYPVVGLSVLVVLLVAAALRLARRGCPGTPAPRTPTWGRLLYGAAGATIALGWAHQPVAPAPNASASLYFSSNNLMVQLAQNPLATGAYAVTDYVTEGGRAEQYAPVDGGDDRATLRAALRQAHTTFADDAGNPLWRTIHTGRPRRRPNVVVVLMESFTGQHVGAMGHTPSRTPFFDDLVERGVFFSHMYAAGPRTNRALAALLCGFPDIGGRSMLNRPAARDTFPSLFDAFAERGYRTLFFCGSSAGFDNMDTFFRHTGLQELVDIDAMPPDAWRTTWAVGDHTLFDAACDRFEAIAGDGPFFAVILTTTNHRPHEVPPDTMPLDERPAADDPTARTTRYADWAMERFMARARQSDYFDNTLFVFVADHGAAPDPRHFVDVEGYRVPCLFYGPGLADLARRRVDTPCSQVDLMPTVLSVLGGDISHGTFGRDLFALDADDPGLALLRKDRATALVRGDRALVLLPRNAPPLLRRGRDGALQPLPAAGDSETAAMHRLALGIYQTARQLFLNRTYGSGPGDKGVDVE